MTPNGYTWMQGIVLGFAFLFLSSLISGVVWLCARTRRKRRIKHAESACRRAELEGIQLGTDDPGRVPSIPSELSGTLQGGGYYVGRSPSFDVPEANWVTAQSAVVPESEGTSELAKFLRVRQRYRYERHMR